MAGGGSAVAFDQRNGTDEGKSAGHCGICAVVREQSSAPSWRTNFAEASEMHIDDLPEDVQGAVRSAASMVGADVNDPDSLKAILLMILGANEEKLTTREDIDHEAGDWDSDDAADENSPTFEINRQAYLDTKDACASATRTLDRAYAVAGRGDAIDAIEARLESTLRTSDPDDWPLNFAQHIRPQLRRDVHLLRSSFRRTRLNDLQLRTFMEEMRADTHKQIAGEPCSTNDGATGARMHLRLLKGVAAMSYEQIKAAHGAFIRCTAVRNSAGAG